MYLGHIKHPFKEPNLRNGQRRWIDISPQKMYKMISSSEDHWKTDKWRQSQNHHSSYYPTPQICLALYMSSVWWDCTSCFLMVEWDSVTSPGQKVASHFSAKHLIAGSKPSKALLSSHSDKLHSIRRLLHWPGSWREDAAEQSPRQQARETLCQGEINKGGGLFVCLF